MTAVSFLKQQEKNTGSLLSRASGAAILSGFFIVVQAWCLARAVDGFLFQKQHLTDILPWLTVGVLAAGAKSLLSYWADKCGYAAAAIIQGDLRKKILVAAVNLGPVRMGRDASGRILTLWMEGVESLNNYYARYIPARVQTAVLPIVILAIAFPVDLLSGLILMVTAPLVPFFMIMIGRDTEKLNQRQWKRLSFMAGYLLDLLQGMRTVRFFQAGKREAEMVRRVSEDYRLETMKVLSVAFLSSLALEFLATISIALVAVIIGFRLFWGEMDFLRGFFILLLAPEFFLPLRRMGVFYHVRMDAVTAAENISNFIGESHELNESRPIIMENTTQPPEIIFEAVSFSYSRDKEVLTDVSFRIPPAGRFAIVGPSGAGKTTILSLVLGLIRPVSGRILVDGNDLAHVNLDSWWRRTGWVPQNPHLFDMTLEDNIRLSCTDHDIAALCRSLQVDEVAESVTGGYHGYLGEKGLRVSGGQAQRVAIARALAKPAGLFLLDEPSARLDIKTEAAIQSAIGLATKGKTILVAAHRLNTIRQMDRIIVLENGRMTALGTHDELKVSHEGYRQAVA
jgi:ATP-binding cassette subfamily C protein CydD